LISQSTCSCPAWFQGTMLRNIAAESNPEASRDAIGAYGPAALRPCASGITRSKLKSVSPTL
jgi:hypothetical protein